MTEIALGSDLMRGMRLLPIVVAILLVGCGGPDAAHYEAVLDELPIPAAWELVQTTVRAPGGEIDCARIFSSCPSVARYYLVAGNPIDAYPDAKQMLAAAGFTLDLDTGPKCDLPPTGPACVLQGRRDSDVVRVAINNPGDDADGLGIAEKDRSIVNVMAEGK